MYNVAMPVFLGAVPALAVGILFALLMSMHTALEEVILKRALAEYDTYVEQTRRRLLPFIW